MDVNSSVGMTRTTVKRYLIIIQLIKLILRFECLQGTCSGTTLQCQRPYKSLFGTHNDPFSEADGYYKNFRHDAESIFMLTDIPAPASPAIACCSWEASQTKLIDTRYWPVALDCAEAFGRERSASLSMVDVDVVISSFVAK